jgi:hypothetical protein
MIVIIIIKKEERTGKVKTDDAFTALKLNPYTN